MSHYKSLEDKKLRDSLDRGEFITSPDSDSIVAIFDAVQKDYKNPKYIKTSVNYFFQDIEDSKKVAENMGVAHQKFMRDFFHKSMEQLRSLNKI